MNEQIMASGAHTAHRLPMAALLALTMTSFVATANETVPAGLLRQIAQGFSVSESWAGQLVTACALGSGLAAIPLTAAVRGWPRRRVLLLALTAFFVCNGVTAASPYYALTLAARFTVGLATGLAWSLLATYARRMVAAPLQGRALAVAMVGIPLALSLGVPLSAWLGTLINWRYVFGLMAGLSLMLMIWVVRKVPDYPAQHADLHIPTNAVLKIPGVRAILFVVVTWILAHYILFTYIVPFLSAVGLADHVSITLLIFGISAMLGIWIVGLLIDRWLRTAVLISLGTFALVVLALGICGSSAKVLVVYSCAAAWGLSFSGAPTLLQTALADAAGDGAEVAQSMLVTVFNLAFAGSGLIGGLLLSTAGVASFPWVLLTLLLAGLLVAWQAKTHGFVPGRRRATR